MKWKLIGLLAAVTFVEGALAVLVTFTASGLTVDALRLALGGGAGALLSFAFNVAMQYKAKLTDEYAQE